MTQLKIREIARVVKELFKRFGSSIVWVVKVSGQLCQIFQLYWLAPSEEAKQKFQEGKEISI